MSMLSLEDSTPDYELEPEEEKPRSWKPWFALAVVVLLAWIGWTLQSAANQRREAEHERARRAAAYLDCLAHAKYTSLCIAPTD
jgi:hypothetical protein